MRDAGIDLEANRPDPYIEDLHANQLFWKAVGSMAFTLLVAVLMLWAFWRFLHWLPATTEIVP